MQRNSDLLIESMEQLETAMVAPLRLEVDPTNPVRLRPYQLPYSHENFVTEEIKRLLRQGVIEPSMSPWRSPVVVVKKKGGKFRLCIDFREFNKKIKDSAYMLPRIDEILESQRERNWFTSLDLFSGYHQIPLAEGSKNFTSFLVKNHGVWEIYRYNVLTFGLKFGLSEFQRIMNEVFQQLLGRSVQIYLDD